MKTSIDQSIKKFKVAEKTYEKPEPREAVVVELDEMWHYLHQKKQIMDMESLLSCYHAFSDKLIDWECGSHDKETLKRLLDRLKLRNIWFYFTDH